MADDRQNDDLDARIAKAKAAGGAGVAVGTGRPDRGYTQGSRVLAELIGAPAGGALLGWALDRWLGTGHWLLLVFLVLGVIVAFRNIFRISKEHAE